LFQGLANGGTVEEETLSYRLQRKVPQQISDETGETTGLIGPGNYEIAVQCATGGRTGRTSQFSAGSDPVNGNANGSVSITVGPAP
jgi:hypothetical protein